MSTKIQDEAIIGNNTLTVTFSRNKETDRCVRMGAQKEDEPVFGALYILKDVFPEGCTRAIVTVEFKED
jgi:hypothetical protein